MKSPGALYSALLHGTVILLLLIGIPELFRRDLEPPPIIPIDVINIADLTKAPDLRVKPKEDSPQEKPKDKPTPPKPKPEPVVEKVEEPEPEEPLKEKEPTLTMDELLDPMIEKEVEPEPKPKEKEKEKPKKDKKKKEKKKKKPKDFASLLNNLDKDAKAEGKTQPEQDENATADKAARNVGELSVTLLDLVRRQLGSCWNVPAGARDGKDLYVDIKLEMNPDATVRTAVVKSHSKGPYGRVAADAALRAVHHPNCSPLKLPLDRYDQWKTMTIRFDPQHIL